MVSTHQPATVCQARPAPYEARTTRSHAYEKAAQLAHHRPTWRTPGPGTAPRRKPTDGPRTERVTRKGCSLGSLCAQVGASRTDGASTCAVSATAPAALTAAPRAVARAGRRPA